MHTGRLPIELLVWAGGLTALALSAPGEHHFTICPFYHLGLSWCPGCGLGRSISHLLHGNVKASFREHWFGIPAFTILGNRILILIKIYLKSIHILT